MSAPQTTAPVQTPSRPGSRRLLLVEDSATLRKAIRIFLLPARIDLTTASNGLDAVTRAEAAQSAGEPFDLILMDVVMPELNGVEATYQLRQRGYAGKIVILTAADAEFDMAASLCAGADDFLAKPFGPDDLLRVIATHCGAKAA